MAQLMPPILSNDLVLPDFVSAPCVRVLVIQENSLEDMLFHGQLLLLKLILEIATVETHFQLAGILGRVLDEVHAAKSSINSEVRTQMTDVRSKVFAASINAIRIVSSANLVNGQLLVKIDGVPFLDVVKIGVRDCDII